MSPEEADAASGEQIKDTRELITEKISKYLAPKLIDLGAKGLGALTDDQLQAMAIDLDLKGLGGLYDATASARGAYLSTSKETRANIDQQQAVLNAQQGSLDSDRGNAEAASDASTGGQFGRIGGQIASLQAKVDHLSGAASGVVARLGELRVFANSLVVSFALGDANVVRSCATLKSIDGMCIGAEAHVHSLLAQAMKHLADERAVRDAADQRLLAGRARGGR
jgi:hypothetical protein